MESSNWLKLTAIFAIILGSLYVLAPSFVEWAEGAPAGLTDAASAVDRTAAPKRAVLTVELDVAEGDPAALRDAAEARLRASETPYEKVIVEDGGLRIELRAGARPAEVGTLLTTPGELALFRWPEVITVGDPTEGAVSTFPPALIAAVGSGVDPAAFEAAARAAAGTQVPATARPARLAVASVGPAAVRLTAAPAEDPGALVLALDGRVVGLVSGSGASLDLVRLGESSSAEGALLSAGPLPGALTIRDAVSGERETVVDAPVVVEKLVPDWFRGILSDTAMNLGLDLQGGVDLTLYVGLDEAVLGRVNRDLAQLAAAAADDGIEILSARRERNDPVIMVESTAELSDLQAWFARRMNEYAYRDSPTGPEGQVVHAFEMTDEAIVVVQEQAVEQVLETLRERIDETGVREPSIVKKGGGRINVQLPGKVDLGAALKAIGTTAVLEFRLVDEEFDAAELDRMVNAARTALPEDQFQDDLLLNDWLHDTGRLAPDRLVQWEYVDQEGVKVRSIPYPLKYDVVLTGNDVNNAGVAWDNNQRPYVALEFKPQGARVFCDVTTANVQKRFAIVLDGKVRSAPNIRERICGGRASIEMGGALDPMDDANTLALVLRTGSLTAPVIPGEVRTVGPTLGADAIRSGALGMAIGSVFVIIFMALWYRTAGLVADLALGVNVLMVFAALSLFGATLTLPGIAGIALTIGMAVDANIIIYERIREEMALGQNARKGVEAGFEKGVVAVLDANITTAIAGVVLYSYGTGPIKGFAVTLLVGIGTTLVTALFVTRTLLEVLTRSSTTRFRI